MSVAVAAPPAVAAGLGTAESFVVRESDIVPVRSDESFVRTEKVPEERVTELAHTGAECPIQR
jgi:hypothetical protein